MASDQIWPAPEFLQISKESLGDWHATDGVIEVILQVAFSPLPGLCPPQGKDWRDRKAEQSVGCISGDPPLLLGFQVATGELISIINHQQLP